MQRQTFYVLICQQLQKLHIISIYLFQNDALLYVSQVDKIQSETEIMQQIIIWKH